jgi:type I restriction enzyme, S subunit
VMIQIPEGWRATTIGEIGRYLNGRGFKKSEWSATGRPIIRIQDLTGTGSGHNFFEGEVEDRYVVRDGDLLMSWAATLDAFIWRGPEAVLNQHIFKVESKVNKRFHYYLLKFILPQLYKLAHGSGMVHVTKDVFESFPVAIPSTPDEQDRIVEGIEKHFTRLDAATSSLLSAAGRLRRLQTKVVIGASSPPPSDRSGWRRASVDQVSAVGSGNTPKGLEELTHSEGEIPWFKVADMNRPGNEVWLVNSERWIQREVAERMKLRVFPAGSLVFPKRGGAISTNKKRRLMQPSALDLNLMCITPSEGLSDFLWVWIQSLDLSRLADGSNVPQINHSDIKPLEIWIPPVETIDEVVARTEANTSRITQLQDAVQASRKRTMTLRGAVLAKAFSGRLVA